jgi:hypothetical protein
MNKYENVAAVTAAAIALAALVVVNLYAFATSTGEGLVMISLLMNGGN